MITTLSAESFDGEVLKADVPVLVDFWAPWCGPCRALAPILEELAESRVAELKVAKLNVDDYPEIAQRYSVSSIPMMIVYSNGAAVKTIVGARPRQVLLGELAFLF